MNQRNYIEKSLNNMFPKPVENVKEVIAKENCIDGENVSQEKVAENLKIEPMKESDIFMQPKKKKEENIVLKVESGEKEEKEIQTKKPKTKRYAHLAAARKKGAETRARKAAERKALKEQQKEEKQKLKEERKKESMERNRQRARDRYYKEKEEKERKEKEKILKDGKLQATTKPIDIPTKHEQIMKQQPMDFDTFANYMLKYENMKNNYIKKSEDDRLKKISQERERKAKEYHPPNYPLAHLYNPSNRRNERFF